MPPALQIILSLVAVIASGVSALVYGKFKVMESSIDTFTAANTELRTAVEFEQNQRLRDKDQCDVAIAKERERRERDRSECDRQVAQLQGRVDALTGNIGDVIAGAVLKTLEVQSSLQGPAHDSTSDRLDRLEEWQAKSQGDGR